MGGADFPKMTGCGTGRAEGLPLMNKTLKEGRHGMIAADLLSGRLSE
jgi:hypothetical protein